MRTTFVLDEDLVDAVRALARQQRCPMRVVINRALRAGVELIGEKGRARPYKTIPRPLGLREGLSYDNVQELLSHLEGEARR